MSLSLLSFYLQKDLTHYEDAVLRFFCEHEKIQSSISLFCDLKEEHREKEDIFDFLHSCSRTEDSISHPRAGST